MSLGAAVLTFREGLEGALIIAIMLGYLSKVGRKRLNWAVWLGALSAGAMAVAVTVTLQILGADFQSPGKEIYEGSTSMIAVVMLTYMIFWMLKQARYIKGSLEHSMKQSLVQSAAWGLFALAFATVAREGIETALFLSASAFQTSGSATLIGGVLGLVGGIGVALVVYVAGVRLQMRTFFRITSLLLVVFGAAILRYGVGEFEEVGWIPPLIEHVWNTGLWLPSSEGLGAILQTLVGYTSEPSLMQLVAYFGYLFTVGGLLLRPAKTVSPATTRITGTNAPAPANVEGAESPRDIAAPVS